MCVLKKSHVFNNSSVATLYFSVKRLLSGEIRLHHYRAKATISMISGAIFFLLCFLP